MFSVASLSNKDNNPYCGGPNWSASRAPVETCSVLTTRCSVRRCVRPIPCNKMFSRAVTLCGVSTESARFPQNVRIFPHNERYTGAPTTPLWACGATPYGGFRPSDSFLSRSEGLVHAEGRPHASWLRKLKSYLKDAGMVGLASAWEMARRRPKEYRRKVDAATRCSGVCSHT